MSNVSLVGKEEDKTKEDEEEKERGATMKIQRLRQRDNREWMEWKLCKILNLRGYISG